ncbi:MAG: hypothetical protein ACRELB_16040, partial [Polyangiaceae bacterium]
MADSRPTREQAFDAFCLVVAYVTGQGSAATDDPVVLLEHVPALYAGVTKWMAYEAARAGEIDGAVKVGRKPAARRSAIEAWLASRKVQPRRRKATEAPPATDPASAYLALVG